MIVSCSLQPSQGKMKSVSSHTPTCSHVKKYFFERLRQLMTEELLKFNKFKWRWTTLTSPSNSGCDWPQLMQRKRSNLSFFYCDFSMFYMTMLNRNSRVTLTSIKKKKINIKIYTLHTWNIQKRLVEEYWILIWLEGASFHWNHHDWLDKVPVHLLHKHFRTQVHRLFPL